MNIVVFLLLKEDIDLGQCTPNHGTRVENGGQTASMVPSDKQDDKATRTPVRDAQQWLCQVVVAACPQWTDRTEMCITRMPGRSLHKRMHKDCASGANLRVRVGGSWRPRTATASEMAVVAQVVGTPYRHRKFSLTWIALTPFHINLSRRVS